MDIKLDANGDLDLTNNAFSYVSSHDAIMQHLKIALRTFRGEWFLNTTVGMPWLEEFLVKNPSKLVMDARLREAILSIPGIASLTKLEYLFDGFTRTMNITFAGTFEDLTDFEFVFTDFVIGD